MVKRFLQARSDSGGGGSRHAPAIADKAPAFDLDNKKAIGPDEDELAVNPRARSARLRVARRTDAPAGHVPRGQLGMPLRRADRD